ncbi:MAG: hypothetical protein K2X86_07535 [Cytophagaceae bacterium]|nr:hypothetical protein [Cytophagaceae bacterium]
MKAEKVYNRFLKTAKYLLKELDYYGENQFRQKIENQWTIGEFYDYLLSTTTNYYIPQVKKSLDTKTGNEEGKKKTKGKIIFWYQRYPAIFKYKDVVNYKPVQPESAEKVKDNFYRFIKIMNRTAEDIDKSSSASKAEHEDFGMLTALEWYQLIEMNFRHQLKIKHEIDRVIRNVSFDDE